MTARTRRLAPLLIAALLAGGGASLATTAHAAPQTTPHVAATDGTPPPVKSIKRIGKSTPRPDPVKRIGRANNPSTAMQDARQRADSRSWSNHVGGYGGTGGHSFPSAAP
ncbi:hypothetical protein ABT237_20430 [Streptomyces sp. NPDC001581]|uniref:hypothetical protein n=1 Tax=Streptomyces sp. NPDC001581 TaxID=3154386 RepID=UPI003328C9C0